MTIKLMLDSGAFSVWSQGYTIDLTHYLEFCSKHPDCTYYVNLDVIPGEPRKKETLTRSAIETSCQAGWENYLQMIQVLPKDKVIPVYHQNEDLKWLRKYLDYGVKYIGISPANDSNTREKLQWMKSVKPVIFDGAGRPLVRQHGFAVTSYDLMKYWEWYSVDSASWKMCASWGGIYLPREKYGAYDFSEPPLQVQVTPQTPGDKRKRNGHLCSMSPGVEERVRKWLEYCEVPMGSHTLETMPAGYKLNYGKADCWLDKKNRLLMKVSVEGVTNSFKMRARVNRIFMDQANAVLPVKNIYLAGLPMPYPDELEIKYRLLSYEQVGKRTTCKWFLRHCKALRNKTNIRTR